MPGRGVRCDAAMALHRLFVALPLPDAVSEKLLDTMEGVPGARWQDADDLHITLRFIGDVDRHALADVMTALESIPVRPFPVSIAGVGHFETRGRARAIWARVVPSEPLAQLQHVIEMACRRAGLSAETRKFVPHVTLARLNSGSGPVGSWLAVHGDLALPAWSADGFALCESHLGHSGAIYERIASFP